MVAAATTSLPETPGGDRNWDYRYSWIRDSTFMLWALYTLGFDEEANDFFYFVADVAEAEEGELQIMYGIGGETKLEEQELEHLSGYEQRAAGADRQRRLQPGPARRLGRGARLDLPAHAVARPASGPPVADHQAPGGGGADALARARPGDLGGPRRAQALHLLEADVLGGRRPRRAAGPHPRRRGDGATLAEPPPTRSTPTSARTAWTSGACSSSTTTPTRSTHRVLLMPLVRFLPPDDPRIRATVLTIADELTEERPRAALPGRRDRRRLLRRGGHVHDLLVLAGVGAGRDRASSSALAGCARSCSHSRARWRLYAEQIDADDRAAISATSPRRSRIWR